MTADKFDSDSLFHSRTCFLIMFLLIENEQTISSIAARLNIKQFHLETKLSELEKVGYVKTKLGVWNTCFENIFYITKSGVTSFCDYLKHLEKLIEWAKKQTNISQTFICLKMNGREVNLKTDSILYIKSCGNYIKIHSFSGIYFVQMTTNKIEQLLMGNSFLRIHKSYIVNTTKITAIYIDEVQLDTIVLPVGKTFRKIVDKFSQEKKLIHSFQQNGILQ